MDPKNRNILLITLFALALRLYFFRYTDVESGQDGYWLAALARGILQGKYELRGEFWGAVQPLYPFLMAVLEPLTGDFLKSGKLISLVSGTLTIPAVYLLWRKIESEETALLAAWLVGVNAMAWHGSMHVYRDPLFLFFAALSFLFLFEARDNYRWLGALGVALGLATLARGTGYILTISCVAAYVFWKREYLAKKKELEGPHNRALLMFVAAYFILTYPWHYIRTARSAELVPGHLTEGIDVYGHLGGGWMDVLNGLATLPLLLLFAAGVMLSKRDWEKYLPFYLFVVSLSGAGMWYFEGNARYAMPLLPLITGFASIAIFYLAREIFPGMKARRVFLGAVMLLALVGGAYAINEAEKNGDVNAAAKEAMLYLDANSDGSAKLLAGDGTIYGYYTDRYVADYISVNGYLDALYKYGLIEHFDIRYPLLTILISENITYFVAYDTITPHLYDYQENQFLADDFRAYNFTFDYRQIVRSRDLRVGEKPTEVELGIKDPIKTKATLIPVGKSQRNGQSVYLYRLEWEF